MLHYILTVLTWLFYQIGTVFESVIRFSFMQNKLCGSSIFFFLRVLFKLFLLFIFAASVISSRITKLILYRRLKNIGNNFNLSHFCIYKALINHKIAFHDMCVFKSFQDIIMHQIFDSKFYSFTNF